MSKMNEAPELIWAVTEPWAEGWTNDSIAAQVSGSALAQIWEMLGAKNQTQAVIKIKELKGEKQ